MIKFAFTANDNYIHFTFGMFGSDDNKVIQSFEGPGRSKAYYFVDDFEIQVLEDILVDEEPVKGELNLNSLLNLRHLYLQPLHQTMMV